MKLVLVFAFAVFHTVGWVDASAVTLSSETEACLGCHAAILPGVHGDWLKSRHAQLTPQEALRKLKLEKRVSVEQVPEKLASVVVGCAECHMLNPEQHGDSFEHNGYKVHVVVTPQDCGVCHPVEAQQYGQNLMSHAYGNLKKNPVFSHFGDTVNGLQVMEGGKIALAPPEASTEADSCLHCHGTVVEAKGLKPRETAMGEMEFPVLAGWPNQGVGRVNPDGSLGSCAACHTRHAFSIEMARKPDTCSQCHQGPDVPAFPVYKVSKHGNLFSSLGKDWDYRSVPWELGKHFTAPTCAACHVSLLVTGDKDVVAQRSHRMNDRLPWRLFGLVYAHAHPKSPDTSTIVNKAGLPLPTELTGEPAGEFLIDGKEVASRLQTMKQVCSSCHSLSWVEGHFGRLEHTIRTSNQMTLAATQILLQAWEKGFARGLAQKDSIFNEAIEKRWVEQWLFYANSTRFASAMAGADYGVFANGRWKMSQTVQEMWDWLESQGRTKGQ
jgi:hydroxylamine dehydrogenase